MESISFEFLLKLVSVICGSWAFYKIIIEIINAITTRHDREKKWDEYEKKIEEVKTIKEDIMDACKTEQQNKWSEYDKKINNIDELIKNNYSDTELKLKEIRYEQCLMTYCMMAVLDGLHQLSCNGKVTEATEKLNKYLNNQAHN